MMELEKWIQLNHPYSCSWSIENPDWDLWPIERLMRVSTQCCGRLCRPERELLLQAIREVYEHYLSGLV